MEDVLNKSKFFYEYNANPWKQRLNDCVPRALSIGLRMKYDAVCDALKLKCKDGVGFEGKSSIGKSLPAIRRRFRNFFDGEVVDAEEELNWKNRPKEFADLEYDPEFDENPDLGFTLNEFIETNKDNDNLKGRYLVGLTTPHILIKHGLYNEVHHMVFVKLNGDKSYFVDTRDSGFLNVVAYLKIKYVLNRKDPRSLDYGISKSK
jgi:hypothetical protein